MQRIQRHKRQVFFTIFFFVSISIFIGSQLASQDTASPKPLCASANAKNVRYRTDLLQQHILHTLIASANDNLVLMVQQYLRSLLRHLSLHRIVSAKQLIDVLNRNIRDRTRKLQRIRRLQQHTSVVKVQPLSSLSVRSAPRICTKPLNQSKCFRMLFHINLVMPRRMAHMYKRKLRLYNFSLFSADLNNNLFPLL